MDSFISKVTSQGQVTLPKQVREKLDVGREDYIEFDSIGNAIVVRKLQLNNAELDRIRTKIKKSGLTKKKALEILEESSEETWKKYAKTLP
jgi:AbrB family looped-hinge helix DNA binding protein